MSDCNSVHHFRRSNARPAIAPNAARKELEMPRKLIVGNWKMHTTAIEAARLAAAIVEGVGDEDRVSVLICPPFPYIALVGIILTGSLVALGGQNIYPETQGAFTGEVSPTMLLDLGCKHVILGHSERRHVMGESDAFINRKVLAALDAGLAVILCVGETLDERNHGQTAAVLERQLLGGLAGVSAEAVKNLRIGYEPVWAIGNQGTHATPKQAQDAHAIVRNRFGQLYGPTMADALTITYGGSVKPANAEALLGRDGVDGALVGGASLVAEQFLAIIRAGIARPQPAEIFI
jgi:triosephosphate isomerase